MPFRGGFGSAPHAGTLDVDTDEVAVGVALRECDGVFALAAAQFEYDRTVVMEKVAVPMSFERMYEGENETYIEASAENSGSILYDKEIRDKPRTRCTKRNV